MRKNDLVYLVLCWNDNNQFWGVHSALRQKPSNDQLDYLKTYACFSKVELKELYINDKANFGISFQD